MANELTGQPTLRLPDELAQEFKRREFAALMRPRAVGLFGHSVGGRAIALRLAERGMRVTLLESAPDADAPVARELNNVLDTLLPIPKGDPEDIGPRITATADLHRLRSHELIVDASMDEGFDSARADRYRQILNSVDSDTPIATVVPDVEAALQLEKMGPGSGRLVPIHLPLGNYAASVVQVIRAPFVHRSAMVRAQRVFDAAGIFVVRAPSTPGLLVDRLLVALIVEACRMVGHGLTDIESVDRSFRVHTLHSLGPLQAADLVGLDAIERLCRQLVEATGDRRYAPPRLLRAYVEQGFLGRKTGRGFYQYSSWTPSSAPTPGPRTGSNAE